jgi:uncharacterized cupin superfamily protein
MIGRVTEESPLEETPTGLAPTGDGWFVVSVRDAAWYAHETFGSTCLLENPFGVPFPELGFKLRVLQPGQPLSLYHEEQAQEDFLVLADECVLLVNGEERPLRAWDVFHSPAGTEHALVGAGDGPAVVLAAGARHAEERLRYPVSALAARHGASAAVETTDGDEAQAGLGHWGRGRPADEASLPWASGD